MFASHGSKQRLFRIPTFLDLVQVPKRVVAQMAIGHNAGICVFHFLANHWNANKTPVVQYTSLVLFAKLETTVS